jgi:molybdenum cofactor biosynthesis enzyme
MENQVERNGIQIQVNRKREERNGIQIQVNRKREERNGIQMQACRAEFGRKLDGVLKVYDMI